MADEPPEPAPSTSVRRPYWVMRLVRRSAVYGGFVTPTLFVPAAVYQQAGATIPGVASKIAAYEAILFTLTHRVVPLELPNESNAAGREPTVHALREARAEFSAVQSSLTLAFSFIDDPDVADRPPSGEENDSTLAAAWSTGMKSLKRVSGRVGAAVPAASETSAESLSRFTALVSDVCDKAQCFEALMSAVDALRARGGDDLPAIDDALVELHHISQFFVIFCEILIRDVTALVERYMRRARDRLTRTRFDAEAPAADAGVGAALLS